VGLGLTAINRKVSVGVTLIIILLCCPWIYASAQAQNSTSLTPAENFSIPQYNGVISFAVNGTYSSATLANGSWIFTNLALKGSQTLQNFTVSAQNSNITIFSYTALNFTRQSSRLRYEADGHGKQIFNFVQVASAGQYNGIDWTVISGNSTFLAQGPQWTISPNGTVVVNGISGNVSVVHYGFFDVSFGNPNLPFYQQHSVAIAIAVSLVIVVALAVVIKVRNKEPSKNDGKEETPK
jgi:hypothetical protein